jgi:hypothetical protein
LLPPIIAQAEFGPADIPRVVALLTAINQAVFAFAPFAFGVLHDVTGGYAVTFSVAAVFQLAAGAIVLTGRQMPNSPRARIVQVSDTNPRVPDDQRACDCPARPRSE